MITEEGVVGQRKAIYIKFFKFNKIVIAQF